MAKKKFLIKNYIYIDCHHDLFFSSWSKPGPIKVEPKDKYRKATSMAVFLFFSNNKIDLMIIFIV